MVWFDIIIFAAVAAFLAYRLHSVLGQQNDDEPRRGNPFSTDGARPAAPQSPNSQLPPIDVPSPLSPTPASSAALNLDTLAGRLAQIHQADTNFSEKGFLAGARGAFEMIVTAFAAEDTAALRPLLSDDVYDSFAGAIRARQSAKEKLETRIVRIRSAELIDAGMTLNTARVTVRFDSEQIQVTRDANGAIVDGDAEKSVVVTDRWTFSRNTRSNDPNWHLSETRSES